MARPCDGIRILDFTEGMTGNLVPMVLGDFGAEVIRVERPGGDPWQDQPAWPFWNRGKRIVTLDLKSDAGRARARELARDADVVVESWRPGVADRLGVGYEALSVDNPALVYCSISGFGSRSPWAGMKAYEAIVDAKTGRMAGFSHVAGRKGPGYNAVPSAGFGAVNGALQGILAALRRRRRSGVGTHVEATMQMGNTAYDMGGFFSIQRNDPKLAASRSIMTAPIPRVNYITAVTKDGVWLQFANTVANLFRAQQKALGLEHLYDVPKYRNLPNVEKPEDNIEVWETILERVRSKTWAEWKEILDRETDVAVEPLVSTEDAFDHAQIRHNGHIVTVDGKEQPGPLVMMTATPGEAGPAALRVASADWAERPAAPAGPAPDPSLAAEAPLAGKLVVDFANYYATPFGPALLAEQGARVIKVEPPEGEYARHVAGGMMPYKTAAGKEALAIDLKAPESREVMKRLLSQADVLVHNFRPGVPERLGIGYEDVKAYNPDIVYHYGASYGPTGPYSFKPAMHPSAGAGTGTARIQMPPSVLGENDAELPMDDLKKLAWRYLAANEGNPDVNAALGVGTGLMMGIQAQEANGAGQSQYSSMFNSSLYACAAYAIRYPGKPALPDPDPDLYGTGPLYRLYQAQEGWVFLACPFEHEWQALARALGHEEWLADPRFADAGAREANAAALAELLAQCFGTRTAGQWESDLAEADVACARVDERGLSEFAINEPVNRELGFAVQVHSEVHGDYWRHGPLARIEGAPATPRALGELGEHTRPLLRELGFSEAEVDSLRDRKIVFCRGE